VRDKAFHFEALLFLLAAVSFFVFLSRGCDQVGDKRTLPFDFKEGKKKVVFS